MGLLGLSLGHTLMNVACRPLTKMLAIHVFMDWIRSVVGLGCELAGLYPTTCNGVWQHMSSRMYIYISNRVADGLDVNPNCLLIGLEAST